VGAAGATFARKPVTAMDATFATWLCRIANKTKGRGLEMKKLFLAAALVLAAAGAKAQYTGTYGTGSNSSTHTTSGYTRSNGTYVAPYVSTNPNSTQRDNYGATGNYNPYTGATGTRTPRY
jgi:hypothetical protein